MLNNIVLQITKLRRGHIAHMLGIWNESKHGQFLSSRVQVLGLLGLCSKNHEARRLYEVCNGCCNEIIRLRVIDVLQAMLWDLQRDLS